MLTLAMHPGDFVDRGAWGTELLAVLAAWKLALPSSVLLLRGNHESTTCTKMYGFHAELQAKFGVKSCAVSLNPVFSAGPWHFKHLWIFSVTS